MVRMRISTSPLFAFGTRKKAQAFARRALRFTGKLAHKIGVRTCPRGWKHAADVGRRSGIASHPWMVAFGCASRSRKRRR